MMKNLNPAQAYRQMAARSANPTELIGLLLDTAVDCLHRALRAIEENNVETRAAELNHTLSVVGELQGSLDFENGGEVAHRLDRFYTVARGKILEASFKSSTAMVKQLAGQFASLREAWQEVVRNSGNSPAPPPSVPPAQPVPPPPACLDEPVPARWSA